MDLIFWIGGGIVIAVLLLFIVIYVIGALMGAR